MSRKGLGKGLDSLIPKIYNENFDSNSTQSLEDMLNENEEVVDETPVEDDSSENIFEQLKREQLEEENSPNDDEEVLEDDQENVAIHAAKRLYRHHKKSKSRKNT